MGDHDENDLDRKMTKRKMTMIWNFKKLKENDQKQKSKIDQKLKFEKWLEENDQNWNYKKYSLLVHYHKKTSKGFEQ